MAHRFRHARTDTPATRARKRDYNSTAYRAAGEAARVLVRSGKAYCWRCRGHIPATARRGPDWQLGHDDDNRTVIRGPECTPCNRKAAARKGNRVQSRATPKVRRVW